MSDTLQTQIETFLDITKQPIAEGWCTVQKANVLSILVLSNRIRSIVEIGIFGGRSLIPMAMALKHQGFGCAWGIDPWERDAALEGDNGPSNDEWWKNVNLENIYIGFANHVLRLGLSKECRWIRSRGEDALGLFKDGSIELLHLDSNHSEMASCRDVDLWAPKLAKSCFWVMDDTNWPTQAKAIQKIKDLGFELHQDHQTYAIFKR